jgi:superfamily II DNA/RNA helicase
LRLQTALAIGGVSMGAQVRALLNGVDVLVATPGRLLDLVQSNALRLNHVEAFVLDEADRMLDMGFIHDIRRIIAKLPAKRQTLLFSATMPADIAELARQMLKDPAKVAVTPAATTVERVSQRIVHIDRGGKARLLAQLLRTEAIDRALIFTRTKHGADKVVRSLHKDGIAAAAIHGNKSQNQRERVLANFRTGRVRILVATDIAARGIDIDGISHVINFDLPNIPESYVHRIGRTARAGSDGTAISLCSYDDLPYLRDIERLIRMAIPATGQAPARPPHRPQPHNTRQGRYSQARSTHERKAHRQDPRPQSPDRKPGPSHQPAHSAQPRPNQPRPIASTKPIGGDFARVAFMQPR